LNSNLKKTKYKIQKSDQIIKEKNLINTKDLNNKFKQNLKNFNKNYTPKFDDNEYKFNKNEYKIYNNVEIND